MQEDSDKLFLIRLKILTSSFKTRYIESDIFMYITHIFMSVILGLLAGAGAILFHVLLERMRLLFEGDAIKEIINFNGYYIIFIPVVGGIITSTMSFVYPKISKEKGVLSVIKSIILRKGFIPLKETVYHLFAPILSIGTGAPLGPEGPAAKIGSGIGSFMSQIFKLSNSDMVMYTAAGAGAAISAVFNAPIAGVFFGIEVILLNDLKNRALSALIISSVVADILSRAFLGDEKIFMIPAYETGDLYVYPYYFGLAILCGIFALFYFWISDTFKIFFNDKLKISNPYLKLIPVTLLFGVVLVQYYEMFGIGYSTINSVFNQNISFGNVAVLLVLKIVFLALFLQAGAYGGTFAPSLSIGAFLGFLFAVSMNKAFSAGLDPTAFALVGMGGALAGINSIPLTSILLVFEITNDYKFILPLMLVSIISYLVIIYYKKGSIYTIALLNYNIDVSKRSEMDILGRIDVESILKKDMDIVDYRTPFRELLDVIINSKYGDVFVVNDKKKLVGIITLKDVRQALMNHDLVDLLIANDLIVEIPAVKDSDPLSLAIQKIKLYDIDNIPVVSSDKKNDLIGIITHKDIILTYNRMLDELENNETIIGGFFTNK